MPSRTDTRVSGVRSQIPLILETTGIWPHKFRIDDNKRREAIVEGHQGQTLLYQVK